MAENEIENTRTFRRSITAADGTGIIQILSAADSFAEYAELSARYILQYSGQLFGWLLKPAFYR